MVSKEGLERGEVVKGGKGVGKEEVFSEMNSSRAFFTPSTA